MILSTRARNSMLVPVPASRMLMEVLLSSIAKREATKRAVGKSVKNCPYTFLLSFATVDTKRFVL